MYYPNHVGRQSSESRGDRCRHRGGCVLACADTGRARRACVRQISWARGTPGHPPGRMVRSTRASLHDAPRPRRRRHYGPLGWQVQASGERHSTQFDAVVLALPPAQAAPLLSHHRSDWARHAAVVAMQPCWTLMGVADAPQPALGWDLARPRTGPFAWVLRNDARPGRERVPGQAHWVAHARSGWSRLHLEQPAAWVQPQMQAALAEYLGRPVGWHHCVVHRWRYALPQARRVVPAQSCWWDAARGLGVCGDFLGGSGVEGAWLSAQSLSAAVLQRAFDATDAPTAFAAHEAAHHAARRVVD